MIGALEHSAIQPDATPVRLRARRDLVISESQFQGEFSWVVKDPLALKYFRLRRPEYDVLMMLDGTRGYRQIRNTLQADHPEHEIKIETVQQLVNSLHQNGLLVSDSPGQAQPLVQRRNKEIKQKAIKLLSSALAIRLPGVDPDRFLDWLYPKCRWFFSPLGTLINILLCISALVLIAVNFSEFTRRLPELQQFFGLNNLVFMGVLLMVTKTIHELGHGLMCKHFKGECHEIGVMLLALMPAMYCNTSDSWTLPSKWKRMAIGAAGMYVEIVLAAICTFVWWNTQPGFWHYLALNVMFLSGVSTILFNANPLLRYDGYYILSDFLEIPNLTQKSRMAMLSKFRETCLGMNPVPSRMLPQRNLMVFALFAVASFVYLWVVIILISWFICEVLEPYGLKILGHFIVLMSVTGMVVVPLFKAAKFMLYPGRFREVKKIRLFLTCVCLSAVTVAVLAIPLPHFVWAHFVVQPADAQTVYVTQPGVIEQVNVSAGQTVTAGDTLMVLRNRNALLELQELQGNLAAIESELTILQLSSADEISSTRRIKEAESERLKLQRTISIKQTQIDQLKLKAGRDGQIIAPPNLPHNNDSSAGELESWTGTPFDRENRNAFLPRNSVVCLIGNPNQFKATLIVEQANVKLVETGQMVRLVLINQAGKPLESQVTMISQDPIVALPRELSSTYGGPVTAMAGADGLTRPLSPSYEVSIPIASQQSANSEPVELVTGMRGLAKIKVGQSTIAHRLMRYFQQIINFK